MYTEYTENTEELSNCKKKKKQVGVVKQFPGTPQKLLNLSARFLNDRV